MVRVAIVGSRECGDVRKRLNEIREVLMEYHYDCVVVSGGARGIDTLAQDAAEDAGVVTDIYPADWEKHGKKAGYLRNQQIVDNCDIVHAWWNGKSKGTKHTIDLARKAGKPVVVHSID